MIRNFLNIGVIFLISLSLSACKDVDLFGAEKGDEEKLLENVRLSKQNVVSIAVTPDMEYLYADETQQFTATGLTSDNIAVDLTGDVTWSVDNSSLANINPNTGLVTVAATLAASDVLIVTASIASLSAMATINISTETIATIDVTPAAPTVTACDNIQFQAMANYATDPTRDITARANWSDDVADGVARIVSSGVDAGLLRTSTEGVAPVTVTATFATINGTSAVTIDNAGVTAITTHGSGKVGLDGSISLIARATIDGNADIDVTENAIWAGVGSNISVSDADGSKGTVTGTAIGNSAVTATCGGITSLDHAITVEDLKVVKVEINVTNPNELYLIKLNNTLHQFTVDATLSDDSVEDYTQNVTWGVRRLNGNIISVNQSGEVTAQAVGYDELYIEYTRSDGVVIGDDIVIEVEQ